MYPKPEGCVSYKSSRVLALIATVLLVVTFAYAGTHKVLYEFTGGVVDGTQPNGKLVADAVGNLYGTTSLGGITNSGTVFELSPPLRPGGQWTETVLHSFSLVTDGANPYSGLIFDAAGNLYGTTFNNGPQYYGTVYELSPPTQPGGDWSFKVLYSFRGDLYGNTDAGQPAGGLVSDRAGNLYGTTAYYGQFCCGVVFELSPPSMPDGNWTETILHSFTGPDGETPLGTPVLDEAGNLYATTSAGGTGCQRCQGTVFELTLPAFVGGPWLEKVLHSFHGYLDGFSPGGEITLRGKTIYGSAYYGGPSNRGTVFQISPPSAFRVLYDFGAAGDGADPSSDLIFDPSGNIYGTTNGGGAGTGSIFELTPPQVLGDPWTETLLYSFGINQYGAYPAGPLIQRKGAFYGITQYGGSPYCFQNAAGCGTFYQFVP